MSRRISEATKRSRGCGTGTGADYKPYVHTSEFNSLGTTSVIRDWKTGRGVHCMSQGEALWYYILRWDDNNVDIREQFPLWGDDHTNAKTKAIAERLGVRHPGGEGWIMTTDFLVTEEDGRYHAYSVKSDRGLGERTLQKLCIEKLYWAARGVPFDLLFKTDVNEILAGNIRLVTEFYDQSLVFDGFSALKHLIATKQYVVDMEHETINTGLLGGRR